MPDPDFEIRGGGGGGHPGRGGSLQKKFVQPFGPQFGLKIRGGGGPSCGSTTARGSLIAVGSLRVGVATGRALK